MNAFLKIFGVIALSVIVVGLIIPNNVNVRRSVTIDAPVQEVHRYTNDLTQWPKWSPWFAEDSSIKTTLGEITKGEGASQEWTSASGNGKIDFIASSIEDGIQYQMQLDGDSTIFTAGFEYEEKGRQTIVVWYMTGEMKPIIIGNYFSLLMDSLVGGSFTDGLTKLKEVVEADSK